jgi:hypothetical protein
MTAADYALIVSITSIIISFGSLIWNVWQKFLFVKPKLQVAFGVWRILQPGTSNHNRRLLNLVITNMGPGPVIVHGCAAKPKKPWWRRAKSYGLLNPIDNPTNPNLTDAGPFAGGLPAKLDAADTKSFYFPYEKDGFLKERLARVGIGDSYQRITWCRRKDMRKVYESYRRDFPGAR